jgi:hypothetical protein
MKERDWIEPIVQRVVGQVLDSHVAQLRNEIVSRVMEEIADAQPSDASQWNEPTSAAQSHDANSAAPMVLARAVAEIQLGSSQKEILRALLDTSARYASRVALFVVKGSRATGWQGRGFANSDAIKDFPLDENCPAVVNAICDRVVASAPTEEIDARFRKEFGAPASGAAQILPLILKDKVAALVYADSGTDGSGVLEAGSLEVLVLSTGAWLEVNSLRKQAQKEPAPPPPEMASVAAGEAHQAAVNAISAYSDPFAAHPAHAMAASASASPAPATSLQQPVVREPVPAPAPTAWGVIAEVQSTYAGGDSASAVMEQAIAEPLPADNEAYGPTEAEAIPEMPVAPPLSPEEQEVHHKAQRFARLLVDEIKLYNQAKVMEGRKTKDLYDRLAEVIEKSRATYQKRYGTTVAASGNYFNHEIIRSLAEDDVSIMGANFRQ